MVAVEPLNWITLVPFTDWKPEPFTVTRCPLGPLLAKCCLLEAVVW